MSDFIVADERLDRALREAGVPFEADESGDATVVCPLEDGRTQVVICQSSTFRFGDRELRKIVSPAYMWREELPRKALEFVLDDNYNLKIGAWATISSDGQYVLVFQALAPALLSLDTLCDVIQAVAVMANDGALTVSPPNP